MPTYYVGAGGNDANNGLTWATRKLTLNGAENVPVVAGDTVWVAPGVYREMLTCDVSGAAGSPITYIGDVTGEHTDGVGDVVRVTGSDNDQTATRASCITGTSRNYRIFRGFLFDTSPTINCLNSTNWIIEDCVLYGAANASMHIKITGASQANHLVRRCMFVMSHRDAYGGIRIEHTGTVDNTGHVIEDCVFIGASYGLYIIRVGGITMRNCSFLKGTNAAIIITALSVGQTVTVNNCLIQFCTIGLQATILGEIIENYNAFFGNVTDRHATVGAGANSNSYTVLPAMPILHAGASQVSGFRFPPPLFGSLSQWSQVRAIADTGAVTEDMLGLTRPVTAGKRSWGAVQYVDMERDTTTVRTGTASKKLADAGRDQIYVPTTAINTVFSVYVYREANYAGVNPQMIIKQPGQADTVVTDAGAAGAWNLLTTTLTPAALPGYVVIELVSNNTAAAGNYAVYFDDLTVT